MYETEIYEKDEISKTPNRKDRVMKSGDIVSVVVDFDGMRVVFYRNNIKLGTIKDIEKRVYYVFVCTCLRNEEFKFVETERKV